MHLMFHTAIKMRNELDEYFLTNDEFKELFLDDQEWKSISDLCELLSLYATATDEFSAADHPTANLVISYLSDLKEHLDSTITSQRVSCICSGKTNSNSGLYSTWLITGKLDS